MNTHRTAQTVPRINSLRLIVFLMLAFLATMMAFAAVAAEPPASSASGVTLDLTGIAASIIAGIFAVLGVVLPMLINNRMKDKQAADTLNAAVKNSLGAAEQAATTAVTTLNPTVTIPGVPASLTVPVQYVLDHAGDEAARFNITPAALASKISAQIGLAKIAAALPASAVTGPATSATSSLAILAIPPVPAAAN